MISSEADFDVPGDNISTAEYIPASVHLKKSIQVRSMKSLNVLVVLLSFVLFPLQLSAQKTELTISFSEQFFDALLDAVFLYAAPPEFSLAGNFGERPGLYATTSASFGFGVGSSDLSKDSAAPCNESVKL